MNPVSRLHRNALLLGACLIAAPLSAHDDDPKLLDRQAPYAGPGYRPAAWISGGSQAGLANLAGTALGGQVLLSSLSDGHVQYESSGVQLLSWMPLAELGGNPFSGNDCWGYVSPSGKEYAIIGTSKGTSFVDISTPSDPVLVQFIAGEQSLWRDVKIYQHYAYMVSEGGGGIQVVDLGQIDGGIVTLVNTILSGGNSDTHNVAIDTDSGYLYRCGGGSGQGLRIYGLSNPVSPNYLNSWNSRYVHDVQVVTYTSGPNSGKQIAFACSGYGNGSSQTGLTIIDVTNKNNLVTKAQFYYPNPGYSHQAWLSEDRQYLYLNDELDENGVLPTTTHVINVSNISSPSHAGTFTNGNKSIGHNLYTLGNRVFEANYRSGLRIFDVSSPVAGSEIAYFDTWPGDDKDAFNGLWSCYPYFPSGIVIGSDLERGLFVWWIGEAELGFDVVGGAPERFDPAGDSVTLQLSELNPGDLQAGSETLYYDVGAGIVEVPLASQGAGSYQAQFPALTCGTVVHWFVGARSTDGILWTLPLEAPYNSFDAVVAEGELVVFEDDMETDKGWTAGDPSDTATSGFWVRADPVPSAGSTGDDHSPNGTLCWQTGLNGDVDGGVTTLNSPVFDLSSLADPVASFWLWFRRDGLTQAVDQCRIEVSNDGGAQWTEMELIQVVPPELDGSWMHKTYHLANWVAPSSTVKIRVRAQEDNLDTFVEALIDDFKISQLTCGCSTSNYCTSSSNSAGTSALISSNGNASIGQNNFALDVTGAVPGNLGLFFYGSGQTQLPLAEGSLCIAGDGAGIQRLQPPQQLDIAGAGSRFLDFTQPPASSGSGAILVGSTWNFQFWYRDPAGGPGGSNLSDALAVTFCQ
jgi:choice-of-anchor B domain-containing protein